MLIQEHWLFDCQIHLLQELHKNLNGSGKAVDMYDPIPPSHMPRGYGGVTILWKRELDDRITPLNLGNERIQCVEIRGNPNTIFISVYLPFNWKKVDKIEYKTLINDKLEKFKPISEELNLDQAFDELNKILSDTISKIAPRKLKGKKRKKLQVMNDEILQAVKRKKTAFYIWKQHGRPTEPGNFYLKEKTITTYDLRKLCRKEQALERINARQQILDAKSSDTALFHKLIRKQRGEMGRFFEELIVENETYQTSDSVLEGWTKHFEDLAKKSNYQNFDQNYLEAVEDETKIILKICKENYSHEKVSIQELKNAVKKLNTNKAMDYYGITAENFIYASDTLLEYLQLLINTSFEHCYIPNLLKIGTLFPVFKNKGDIKNAKNYRGITVTPTYSKIIEIIIKGRENNKILKHQNPLQKGFTAKSTPLLCELFIEEFERENKDLKLPTYIALLDGKSAFDVVVHKNLIRRLFQIGFSQQSILLISNLYENATSCVKWGNTMSNRLFNIEQGVRQGGAISADLYKVYINPLLQILSNSGLGAKIGNINCCAPTCADDIALISNNPFELQNMINIAVDFSQREGYLLQPQKSVVLPIKTCNKMLDVEQGFWKLKNIDMPIVQDSSHIGIKKSQKDSTNATIIENIKRPGDLCTVLWVQDYMGKMD
ncbi:Hypothetical predicted protein [Mytilus galloprovincialis]|uniref:Reverse transcriptase domain-containing protein n=1 Tax=Mytilus galloprovincialis TaxID=29158 RepID=A0A8B6BWB4_MYTGA|nr:Hypothetical predicted protein [Mytilus galloprovincialis]